MRRPGQFRGGKPARVAGHLIGARTKRVWVCGGCDIIMERTEKGPPGQCQGCGRMDWTFVHSKGEAVRWAHLRLQQRAGIIRDLERQKPFPLVVIEPGGERYTIGKYISDFTYVSVASGKQIIEDYKGNADTDLGAWKRKHCEAQYNVSIKLVTNG